MRSGRSDGESDILTAEECKALATRVIDMVGRSQAEVIVYSGVGAGTQFARGDTHLAMEGGGTGLSLSFEADDRHARVSTSRLDDTGLRDLVDEARIMAREHRTPTKWNAETQPAILPPQQYTEGPRIFFDANVAALSGEAQADVCRRAMDAAEAKGLISAGDLGLSVNASAVLNTSGLSVYERSTYGELSVTARTKNGTGSGWGWGGYEDWARVNVDAVIERAVDLAQRSANPVAVEPGRYTVILEPTAVADLLHPIIGYPTFFLSARAADENATIFSKQPRGTNKIGLKMMDERLSMVSSPWDPERPSSTMAGWRPVVPVTWFEKGVLKNLAYDPWYAKERARPMVLNPGGVRLAPDGPSQSFEEMVATTKRGVWVNRFSHVGVIDNGTLLLSGTTRDGTFLIENGKITKAIKNFRFLESPFYVFNQLEAWGEPIRASQLTVAPRLKARDFNFVSLTDAV